MSVNAIQAVRGASWAKGALRAVLYAAASYADPNGGNIFPSHAAWADAAGVNVRTLQRCIVQACEAGALVRTGSKRSGRGRDVIVYKLSYERCHNPVTGRADPRCDAGLTSHKERIEKDGRRPQSRGAAAPHTPPQVKGLGEGEALRERVEDFVNHFMAKTGGMMPTAFLVARRLGEDQKAIAYIMGEKQ